MTAPALAEDVKGKGRHYRSSVSGELYPSITNVLKVKDKAALKFWAAKMVAEAAVDEADAWQGILAKRGRDAAVKYLKQAPWDSSDKAATRGDQVHNYLEARALGRSREDAAEEFLTSPEWLKYQPAAEAFLDGYVHEFVEVEKTVFSETHGYAGTGDFIIAMKRTKAVVYGDYKTSKRIYADTALQLAAGRWADRIEKGDGEYHPVPETAGAIAVRIAPTVRGLKVHPMDAGPETFQAFLGLLAAWRWVTDHEDDAVGKHLPPRITTE